MAAPVLLGVAILRPDLAFAALFALVVVNAGLVLGAEYGIPNVERALLLVVGVIVAIRPERALAALRGNPILIAAAAFAATRILSALLAPGADAYDVTKELVFGLLLLVVVSAAGGVSPVVVRRAAMAVVSAASLMVLLGELKLAGVGGTWAGFAADVSLTPQARELALRSLEPASINSERVSGPLGDPNFWAQALVLVLPLALWLWRDGWSRVSSFVGIVGTGLIVLGIFQTGSRGGILALAVAFSVWLWLSGGRLRRLVVVVPILLAIGVVASGAGERFGAIPDVLRPQEARDASIRGRASEALVAVDMFRDHPITGIGAGEYSRNYAVYAPRIGLDERPVREPHNSYLEMAAESGILGAGAFALLVGAGIASGLSARRRLVDAGRHIDAGLAAAAVSGLAGYALAAIFLHQGFPQYLWLVLGLIGATVALSRQPDTGAPDG